MATSAGTTWLKYGCLGCVSIVAVTVLIGVALTAAAWLQVRSESVESRSLTREIAGTQATLPAAPEPVPSEPTPHGEGEVAASKRLRVELDLRGGEFHVEPAPAGEPIRIEGKFDTRSYELVETYEPAPDGVPVYRVEFHRTGSGLLTGLRQALGGSSPEVLVRLPLDAPLALDVHLEQGGAQLELGGLWITSADIVFLKGGFELEVSEPLREPMGRMSIRGRMGGFASSGLGNCSPAELDVDLTMGGMDLDLRGDWRQDSRISLGAAMGGGAVRLPAGVRIEGLDGWGLPPAEQPEVAPPTLRFSTSVRMGAEFEYIR